MYNRIIKWSIYLLVFLLPLFWLPFSFEAFEFNKQYLLFFLVSLAFFFWIAKMVLVDKEIRYLKSPLDIFVLVFLFLAILSAVFSVDKNSSIFGFYGRFSDGLIGLISLVLLYFLITNNVSVKAQGIKNKEQKTENSSLLAVPSLIRVFIWSVFFVILVSYLSIFGVWARLSNFQFSIGDFQFKLPFVMQRLTFNPAAGSMEGLAIFLAIFVCLLTGYLISGQKRKLANFSIYFLLLLSLGLMVIIDFNAAWLLISVSLILFLGIVLWKRIFKENVNRLLLPILITILAVIFFVVNFSNFQLTIFQLLKEQVLAQGISWQIGLKSATENIKSGFLGSGIGTFNYDFAKFKPVEFNQSFLWQIRFDRAGNHISEILGTMGFLGLISYIALVGFFFMVSWFILAAVRKGELFSSLPLLLAFLALIIGQFFYYQNTILAFTFWLILGLSVVSWQKPISEKVISFKAFPEISLIASVFLIILGLLILGCYFFAAKFYLADLKYIDGLGKIGAERINLLAKATQLNPLFPQYKIILARAYLNEVLNEMAKPAPDQLALSQNTQLAITSAKEAADSSLNLVSTWETLGMIYREIRGIATGALEWGIKSFEKAITLEPTNPVLYTELGKLYLVSDDIPKARDNFKKAISLKGDYIDALIQEILILEREGNLPEAISKMEDLATSYPFNIEVAFQLGRLYFNGRRIDDAISQLEGVVALFPNHSNALYSLGAAYQAKGQKEKAIPAFEKVLELNPGNQDVIQKLEELKK